MICLNKVRSEALSACLQLSSIALAIHVAFDITLLTIGKTTFLTFKSKKVERNSFF